MTGPLRTFLLMAVAVVAVSLSGPLMALAVVPPLAIAFWRNAFATVAIAPAVVVRRGDELRELTGRRLGLVLVSGVMLAIHFATWVTSLTLTSVASATAMVCLQLAWIVAWQLLRGERFDTRVLVGLALAFGGVLVVTGVDFTLSTEALVGDALALVGGAAAAAYTVIGSRARQTTSTTTYTFVCYGSCAGLLAVACLVAGQDLGGYPLEQWGLLLLITATAQLLGHSVLNHLLATTSPMYVSLALLLEVPGAALLAALILGQQPPLAALLGLAVMVAGMALVIVSNRGPVPEEAPVG
ncbi:MAG TPA: DMT family transporter [Nocardioides sp.]|uniref:DMT family transporter n=1 Tax=Nocardioides sp. TaxID=35761 RepID=UPI002D7F105B|nr:DMT family transporter [Nocardioides sp.]HET6653140.1 DMT family transporter [Nocardioides sp.]